MAEPKLVQKWKSLSRMQRWGIIGGFCFLFYTIFGFWILPAIVRSQLEKKLTEALRRPTTVQEVKFNPYMLQAEINKFLIKDLEGKEPFISFDSLRVNLQALSLFKRALIVKSFSLVNPYCKIVFNKDESFNFSDLAANGDDAEKKEKEKETKPLLFSINNIDLSGGRIDFDDNVKDVKHRITDLHIAFPFLSNLPYKVDIFTKPIFAAVVNGTPMSLAGESKPFNPTRESDINLNFADIDLTAYLAYLPNNLNFIVKKGRLDLDVYFSFLAKEEGNLALNLKGRASLRELEVVDRSEQPLLSFPELAVEVESADPFRREIHLAKIIWREPELFVQRDKAGALNLVGLVASQPAEASSVDKETSSKTSASPDLLFEVASAAINNANIHFTDQAVPGPMQTTLQPVNLMVNNFSTAQDKSADYSLAITSEKGENIKIGGTFSVNPLKVAADVGVNDLKLDKYRPYYENVLRAEMTAEKLNIGAHLDYAAADKTMLVSGLGVDLGGLNVIGPEEAGKVVIPDFVIGGTEINLKDRTVQIGTCTSKDGIIPLVRRKDGSINLQDFIAVSSEPPAKNVDTAKKTEENPASPWAVTVKAVDFAGYKISFTDQVPDEPAILDLDGLHLAVENMTTRPKEEAVLNLDLLLNKTGKIKMKGKATLSPLNADLDLDFLDLPLKSVQSYVEQNLNIIMTDGLGAVKGKMVLDTQKDGSIGISFRGDVRSRKFVCLDTKQAKKLLTWKDLQINKINLQTNPMRISAREIYLDGVNTFISVNPEGVMNLNTLARQERKKEKQPEPVNDKGTQPEVEIGQIRLANCRVDFSDRSVTPQFKTTLQQISGTVKGLSSSKDVSANVQISGKLDQHSPMKLTGAIHPWQDFFTDINAEFSDIELSPASPYTIKFIGYPLTKGKLSLNLHYLVQGKTLKSENKAFIDQITLGDFIKNNTAVNLPVQLAITLLKNRKGEIDLNIPVTGRLDDPEFSIGGVVFKILYNLIVKAATSPFSLLGAIFEGGGEEQYLQFAAGQAVLAPEETDIVTKLAKALYDRPAIKVDLTGQVDPVEDSKALTKMRFERLLKVQKIKDLARKETNISDVDTVEIKPDEYQHYLKKAYKAADFDRPRNFIGLLKDLPPEEMEKLLYDNIVVTENDLRNLAMERAGVVRDALIEQGPVDPERIFLVEPQGALADKSNQQGARVEIVIK